MHCLHTTTLKETEFLNQIDHAQWAQDDFDLQTYLTLTRDTYICTIYSSPLFLAFLVGQELSTE